MTASRVEFLGMPGIVMTLGDLLARHGADRVCDVCGNEPPDGGECRSCGRISLVRTQPSVARYKFSRGQLYDLRQTWGPALNP